MTVRISARGIVSRMMAVCCAAVCTIWGLSKLRGVSVGFFSVGSLKVSGLFMVISLYLSICGALFLQGDLHLVEQGVEALEVALPVPAVALEPFGCLGERPGFEPSRP